MVTHQDLTERARQKTPSAIHVSVDNFMGSPRYDEIVELIDQSSAGGAAVAADTSDEVEIDILAGELDHPRRQGQGPGTPRSTRPATCSCRPAPSTRSYVASMHDREQSVSTFMGNGLAIPHGTNEAKGAIRRTAISFVRYDLPAGLERQAGRVRDRYRRCG